MGHIDDKILWRLGEISNEVKALRRESKRSNDHLRLIQSSVQDQGMAIAALPCRHHQKRISEIYAKLGQTSEVTGRIQIAMAEREAVTKWWGKALGAAWSVKLYWLPLLASLLAIAGLSWAGCF